jgi:prevent-host-death family protein
MKQLSIREVRQDLPHIDDLLAVEGEVIVTRRGKPIARLLPLETAAQVRKPLSLKWLRDQAVCQAIPSEVLIREDRDGRE